MLPYCILEGTVPLAACPEDTFIIVREINILSCYNGAFNLLQSSHAHLPAPREWLMLEPTPVPLWIHRIDASILRREQGPKPCFTCDVLSRF